MGWADSLIDQMTPTQRALLAVAVRGGAAWLGQLAGQIEAGRPAEAERSPLLPEEDDRPKVSSGVHRRLEASMAAWIADGRPVLRMGGNYFVDPESPEHWNYRRPGPAEIPPSQGPSRAAASSGYLRTGKAERYADAATEPSDLGAALATLQSLGLSADVADSIRGLVTAKQANRPAPISNEPISMDATSDNVHYVLLTGLDCQALGLYRQTEQQTWSVNRPARMGFITVLPDELLLLTRPLDDGERARWMAETLRMPSVATVVAYDRRMGVAYVTCGTFDLVQAGEGVPMMMRAGAEMASANGA